MGDRKLSFGAESMKKYGSKGGKRPLDVAKKEEIKSGVVLFDGQPNMKLSKGDRLELATLSGKGIIRVRHWKGGHAGDIVFAMKLSHCKKAEEPYSFKEKGISLSNGNKFFGKPGRFLVLSGIASGQPVRAAFVLQDPQAWIAAFGLFPEFKKSQMPMHHTHAIEPTKPKEVTKAVEATKPVEATRPVEVS